MNRFELRKTRILTSEFDFENAKGTLENSAEASLTCKTSISKKQKKVKCDVMYAAGDYNSPFFIRAEARSVFRISPKADLETLEKDAKEYCAPIAIQETSQIIQEIVWLHVGKRFKVQPSDSHDDDDDFDV